MRYARAALAAAGPVLLAGAALWWVATPARPAAFPTRLAGTAVATGTYTLYADPATAAAEPTPDRRPLLVSTHLAVVATTADSVVLALDSRQQVGAGVPRVLSQRYVLDRRTRRTRPGAGSWSFTAANPVDRGGAYAVALPPGTGDGPYPLWLDEVGRAVPAGRDGPDVVRDGLTLVPLRARVTGAALTPAAAARLGDDGLAALSLRRLGARLAPTGFDPTTFTARVLPWLSPADRRTAAPYLERTLPVTYTADLDLRLLVEPRTGLVVALDHATTTLRARLDLGGVKRLQGILGRAAYDRIAPVTAAAAGLGELIRRPPTPTVSTSVAAQTAASVADVAGYVAGRLDRPTPVGPLALAAAGGLAVLASLALWRVGPARGARHRRGERTTCAEWTEPAARRPATRRPPTGRPATTGRQAGGRSWTLSRPRLLRRGRQPPVSEEYRVLLPPGPPPDGP